MTHETTTIPLNKLVAWDGNVRKTGAGDGIDELAASIAAHGLLQSLVVRKDKRGKFAVVAGGRRLRALQTLAKTKAISRDADVPCRIVDAGIDAGELSLAENVVRMPMHPADQFEAFRNLIENGASVTEVAARFGVTEPLVTKRLKLGRVSPVILGAYRSGDIDLELVQAFTVSDDHEAQERVWNGSPAWQLNPRGIRAALTEGEIPASDKRVKLVGLDAYIEAGGAVRRDLFGPEDGGYILDAELLDRLVAGKLEAAADQLRGEGWRWVEIMPELDCEHLRGFERRYTEDVPLSEADQAEHDELVAEYDALVDTDDEAQTARLDAIDRRLDELSLASEHWPEQTLAIAGGIISVGYQGDIRIERGLVRPEDRPAEPKDDTSAERAESGKPSVKVSARLIEDLTAQKSAAISSELAQQPDIALAAVVHALALKAFYNFAGDESCLQITASVTPLRSALYSADECKGIIALEAEVSRWADQLPGNPSDLWSWCLAQDRETLLDLLATIAAQTVNAVLAKHDRPKPHTEMLANAVSLDMSSYFTPGADNFFSRISGAGIQAAISEAKGIVPAPGWAKLKKAELAALAERQIAGTGWLPAPLRAGESSDAGSTDGESGEDEALPEAAE